MHNHVHNHVLVGIIGKKGAGKSTIADFLEDEYNFVEYAFANPLKDICRILGAPYKSVYGTQQEKEEVVESLGVSGRQMMQQIGTELFREQFHTILPDFVLGESKNIWVQLFERKLVSMKGLRRRIVVSDVRFPDEADAILRNGGVLIRVVRESDLERDDTHSSETALDGFSHSRLLEIHNNHTENELYSQITNLMETTFLI